MQLNLAKRLLMCPFFNQRLKVTLPPSEYVAPLCPPSRAHWLLPLTRLGPHQGISDIKDMVERVKESELRAHGAGQIVYRGMQNVIRPTVWLNNARLADWLTENMVRCALAAFDMFPRRVCARARARLCVIRVLSRTRHLTARDDLPVLLLGD
jgi:hypothetical protein